MADNSDEFVELIPADITRREGRMENLQRIIIVL